MEVLGQIGKGGFGNVDHVRFGDGREFARKQFSENQLMTPEILENVKKRFSKEVRIQGSIDHPNIVPIVGSDLTVEPPYYLMPIASNSLDKELAVDPRLGGSFIAALSDIVAGLEELHSMEIFHRDLKPHNVLRFDGPNGANYAISDFGLISMKETALSGLTKTGMGKGSDYYTAIEISQDLKNASARSDVFSLGCILHDMVGTEPRVPFREIREGGDFSAILLNATRDDPDKRFASARAFLDAILSIDYDPKGEISDDSVDFIAHLALAEEPTNEFWVTLADFLNSTAGTTDRNAICGGLLSAKIEQMFTTNKTAAKEIALVFCAWVNGTAFNFDLTDAIANRLEEIHDRGDFEVKVESLFAMLELGTSHNRWYVEHKFVKLCSAGMDDNLAKRFVVQMHVNSEGVCGRIAHLERSISLNKQQLHPRIGKALAELCA